MKGLAGIADVLSRAPSAAGEGQLQRYNQHHSHHWYLAEQHLHIFYPKAS